MCSLLLWVWQLPQNLLGLLVILIFRAKRVSDIYTLYFTLWSVKIPGFGISLGSYIIMSLPCSYSDFIHEYGHGIQSRWLGPLYLILVGIPSGVFNNLWDRLFHKKWPLERRVKWYYSRWPEGPGGHWWDRFTADVLGGVSRSYGNE